MNLRTSRLRLTLAVTVAVSVAAVAAALWVAATLGDRARERAERANEAYLADLLAGWIAAGERPSGLDDVFYANTADGWSEPFGENPIVEPPLFSLVTEAGGAVRSSRFSQSGRSWIATVRPLGEADAIVTVTDAAPLDALVRRTGIGAALGALAVVAVATTGTWFAVGRALRPARRALADQQGFLADAAHEMRTPLAVILASSSQALSRPRTSEEYVRSLAEIRVAAERAATGVNELLDLARFDSGQAIPRRAPLRLDLLAEEVAAANATEGVVVRCHPGAGVVVDADLALLRQALDNVVRNAVRRATTVVIATTADGRDGVVEICDDGPGFDPAVLEHVFDRYRRGDRRGEAGMGLAIVKAIAAAHGGAVEAANADGGGAIVRLRVPLARSLV